MGKSYLAEAVRTRLGGTAFLVQGGTFTEENQLTLRENMRDSILKAVETTGNAQLVFDDYHRALKRTQGQRLQANLVALLIDGAQARDIGAILFARCSTPIHLPGRGSPLVSRCSFLWMPRWATDDLSGTDLDPDAVDVAVGSSASLLSIAEVQGSLELGPLKQRLSIDAERVLDDLPVKAVLTLAGRGVGIELADVEQRSLDGLYRVGKGPTTLALDADLVHLAMQRNTGWPSGLNDSARHFAQLLDGRGSAIWCDRYLFKSLSELAEFVSIVRSHTPARLCLLGTERPGDTYVSPAEIRAELDLFTDVECRFMLPADRSPLHDRHLALRGELGGWVVPTADVVVGKVRGGSSIATRAPAFPVDYDKIWQRSRPI
ncbi:hypothetical protein [Cryobacterium algoritolerans]|uniref:hypothetical protein n=1 Tax=Cryobacterium algoritolerans TaxID=1259184 RepID=UPI003B97C8B7